MVGIVIVSHSKKAAEGIYDIAVQMAGDNHKMIAAGGLEDGSIGTDAVRIKNAILEVYSDDGVVVLADIGSGILSARMAIELLNDKNIKIADAPILEGTVSAAVQACIGGSLQEVIGAAVLAGKTSKI